MARGMVSRWPVVISVAVAADERDAEGLLTETAVERIFGEARRTYFDRCATVDEADLTTRATAVRVGSAPVGDEGVTVSVSVVEVFADRFTMNALVRPADGEGIAATAQCSLAPPGGEVTNAMRDEFIALAHAASHFH